MGAEVRICGDCGLAKLWTADYFHRNRSLKGGLYTVCKPCNNRRRTEYEQGNPEFMERRRSQQLHWRGTAQRKAHLREYNLKRKYGLTQADYDALLAVQGGQCAICERSSDRLQVDHCHARNLVRGLLCQNCNKVLGLVDDDPVSLERAAEYLEGAIGVSNSARSELLA